MPQPSLFCVNSLIHYRKVYILRLRLSLPVRTDVSRTAAFTRYVIIHNGTVELKEERREQDCAHRTDHRSPLTSSDQDISG